VVGVDVEDPVLLCRRRWTSQAAVGWQKVLGGPRWNGDGRNPPYVSRFFIVTQLDMDLTVSNTTKHVVFSQSKKSEPLKSELKTNILDQKKE